MLAAINTCPWLTKTTDYDADGNFSDSPKVKGVSVGIPMGFVMIDGEIWNTNWTTEENVMDSNYTTHEVKNQKAFYVLNDRTYKITSTPSIDITVSSARTGATVTVDGINRAPAPNLMLLYNKRIYDQSVAYADAYEVYIECDSSEFRVGQPITGTVTAVYKNKNVTYANNDWIEERPAIGENTVVISARGSTIAELAASGFAVGDTLTVNCSTKSPYVCRADNGRLLHPR